MVFLLHSNMGETKIKYSNDTRDRANLILGLICKKIYLLGNFLLSLRDRPVGSRMCVIWNKIHVIWTKNTLVQFHFKTNF
jgi:hypothetical protein